MEELVAAIRANAPDLFKRWLWGGIEELGEHAVTELLLDWLNPFITRVERDRIVTWNLGVSLQLVVASAMSSPMTSFLPDRGVGLSRGHSTELTPERYKIPLD